MVVTCPTWINLFSPWPYKKSKWLAKCPSIKKWTIWPMAAMPLQLLILPGRRAALVRHQGQRDFYSKTKVSYFAHTNTNDVTKRNIRCKCPLKKKELLSFLFMFWGPKSTQLPTFWTSECTQHLSNHPFLSTPWHLQDVESSTRWPNPRKCRNLSCFSTCSINSLVLQKVNFLSIDYC